MVSGDGENNMSKNRLYRVDFEIFEYGEEYVMAKSKKEAIQKVQNHPTSDAGGTNYSAEICTDEDYGETV